MSLLGDTRAALRRLQWWHWVGLGLLIGLAVVASWQLAVSLLFGSLAGDGLRREMRRRATQARDEHRERVEQENETTQDRQGRSDARREAAEGEASPTVVPMSDAERRARLRALGKDPV